MLAINSICQHKISGTSLALELVTKQKVSVMKKMIVSAFMLAAIASTTYAQSATAQKTIATATQDDNKTKVDPATLPDAVKATLAGDAYKDWKVTSAWAVKADPAYY